MNGERSVLAFAEEEEAKSGEGTRLMFLIGRGRILSGFRYFLRGLPVRVGYLLKAGGLGSSRLFQIKLSPGRYNELVTCRETLSTIIKI